MLTFIYLALAISMALITVAVAITATMMIGENSKKRGEMNKSWADEYLKW